MSDDDWKAPDSGLPVPPRPEAPADGPAWAPPTGASHPGGSYAPPGSGPGWAPAPGGTYTSPGPDWAPPPGAAVPPGPAWTPPPKPGLIPLRPLGFGTLLWAPFRVLRRNPAPTFGSGLLVQLATALATVAIVVPYTFFLVGRIEGATTVAESDALLAGSIGGLLLAMLVPIALSIVAGAFLQGVMVVEVATGTLGEKLRLGELWRRAARRIGPLIGWTLLVAAAVLVVVAALAGVVVLGAAVGGTAIALGVIVALLAGLGCLVLGAWIGVKLSLVPSVIVLEEVGVGRAMARSWRLTNGYFWRTLGIELLVAVILNVAANVVTQPISLLGTIVGAVIDPTGTGAALGILLGTSIATLVLSVLIGAVTTVVQAALVAVIYIDLRMRTEGLDLELERHVELRDSGHPVGDPYRVPGTASNPTAPGSA